MAEPTLRPGVRLAKVLTMKTLLVRSLNRLNMGNLTKGVNRLSPAYGPAAVQVVKAYQKSQKLTADGVVGDNTWAKLKQTGRLIKPLVIHIIDREVWNAEPPKGTPVPVKWDRDTPTWLHHTVTPAPPKNLKGDALLNAERASMRDLQQIAFNRGYSDISYSFLVFPSGNIYEGRGSEILGAHTLGHNSDVGISLVGNYEVNTVTAAQKKAVLGLRKKLEVDRGTFRPHSDVYPTACCGRNCKKEFGFK